MNTDYHPTSPTPHRRGFTGGRGPATWALALVLMAAGGCGRDDDRIHTVTETRPAEPAPEIPADLTSVQRFGITPTQPSTLPPDHPPITPGASAMPMPTAASAGAALAWNAPDGWTEAPARPMRVVTLRSGADDAVECYVAELAGTAGGALANFNRWASQVGQPALSEAAFAALPTITVLGRPAPVLDLTGTYVGMGETHQPENRLLGTLVTEGSRTFFVKLVGPATEVAGQRDAFIAFCESLRLGD